LQEVGSDLPASRLVQCKEVRMKRRIRRLVLAVAAVIAALSINVMTLHAGGSGSGSSTFWMGRSWVGGWR